MFIQAGAAHEAGLGEERLSTKGKRTHQPVRRRSHLAGKHDRTFWRPTNRNEVRSIVLAAKRYELATKQAGKRNGELGHVGIEVLELFANLVSFKTGRLDPSIDFLMSKLKRSRAAIVRALQALRDHGFLDWLRRYVPTGNEGRGVQVQQTSNAYRLLLPRKALQWLGVWGAPTPAPDDFTHASEARSAEMDAYEATLSGEEYARHIVEDDELASTLEALAKAMAARKEREFTGEPESRSRF